MTREIRAEWAHISWSHGMKYLYDKLFTVSTFENHDMSITEQVDHNLTSTEWFPENPNKEGLYKRWLRQMETDYKDLSEKEKDSDREIADMMKKFFDERGYTIITTERYHQLLENGQDEY